MDEKDKVTFTFEVDPETLEFDDLVAIGQMTAGQEDNDWTKIALATPQIKSMLVRFATATRADGTALDQPEISRYIGKLKIPEIGDLMKAFQESTVPEPNGGPSGPPSEASTD